MRKLSFYLVLSYTMIVMLHLCEILYKGFESFSTGHLQIMSITLALNVLLLAIIVYMDRINKFFK